MRFEKIKTDTQEPHPHVTPERKTTGKIEIIRARKCTHTYNTRSKVNHVTTFKNIPKMFKKI